MSRELKLGLNAGYWGSDPPADGTDRVLEAERLGIDSVWSAEAYGSDAFTPLAWWGSQTSRIRLGTAIAQISARTPAATAMAALTMDRLSEGRFVLGLGASGPQVVEGWYGAEFAKPLARTREFVEIVRRVIAREAPVSFEGEHYRLPLQGGTGLAKPLKSILKPQRPDLPIFIAAEGPRNIAQTAEIADGWIAMLYAPSFDWYYRERLAEGFARDGARGSDETFEVACTIPVALGDDVERAIDELRPFYALYFGGMGAKGKGRNFHADVARRMGYERQIDEIQELFLAGRKAEAAAALPAQLVDDMSLVGPKDRIRDRLDQWRETRVDTLLALADAPTLRVLADLF
ncbi:putativecoenzyme F420-dependent oxidoreductase [Patulibacter medicamentivorans]|uniref:Putativecoenzyme F420-dependent oxidoreductase n=1 Tax=Patulibacter medicamentivorans TaxID=1097667 RepID=H0E6R5_9ACTN|nr:LLM class F420-dependent oxidoreductase [Patulibacter medicamentivorans]EHN10628.1 putativecoenzyme F420-dependent oxidoreductase [Patulibacter medicamentivorans]